MGSRRRSRRRSRDAKRWDFSDLEAGSELDMEERPPLGWRDLEERDFDPFDDEDEGDAPWSRRRRGGVDEEE